MTNFLRISDLVRYDKNGNVCLPESLTVGCYAHAKTPLIEDNSDKLATTAWVRAYTANMTVGGVTSEEDPIWEGDKYLYYTKEQADARYLQSFTETDPTVPAHVKAISTGNINSWTAAYTWGDHALAGYLTSFTETDPTVPSHVKTISTTDLTQWGAAYTWGNHALAGYLTSFTETDPVWTAEKVNYFTKTQADARFLQGFTESDPIWTAEKTNYYSKTEGDNRYLQSYTETDPVWTAEKLNYYTKLQGDARYLQSFTETDPVWTAEKTLYYTKLQADARYLQSFTETDPIWTSEKGNYALKTYVDTSISDLVNGAPGALNTLKELSDALGADANFSTTVTNLIATKEPVITAGTTLQYWRGDKSWQTLPVYTLAGLGGVPTTRTLTINGTALDLSADRSWTIAGYTLPTATDSVLGGIKIGSGLSIDANGVVSAAGTYTLPTASATVLGGIKVGTNLSIDANGVLSATDTNTTYSVFTGATTVANGTSGLVTAPVIANRLQFLRGDGTWATPTDTDTTYAVFTRTVAGLVPNPGGSSTTRYLREDGSWVTPPDTDTNTTYSAGAGLTLSGTTFSVTKTITSASTADTIALRDASGYLNAVAFFETSDIRFKNVLETNPVVAVEAIDVIKFTMKGSTEERFGYSAQQVRQFVPQAVSGTDKLTVNYSDVHTLKIAALERKIAELEAKLNAITNA